MPARQRHPLEQRGRRLKRTLLAPVADAALRYGQSDGPVAVRDLVLRRVAFPYFRARNRSFERRIGDGVFTGRTTDMLCLYVFAFGVWEPHISAFVRSRLQAGDVFIDVGANSGWYTLLGAQQVGAEGRVIAIEPSTVLAARLERQVTRNQLHNVRVVQEAVSDHVGRVAVEQGPAEHTGLTRTMEESGEDSTVPCRPLPQMIRDDEWGRITLIKIDVEGAEFSVARGMAETLLSLPADAEVIIEVGPQRARAASEVDDLFSIFRAAGYCGYVIPNEYGVRDYIEYAPVRTLSRVEAAMVSSEVNVLFTRIDVEELPVDLHWAG